MRREHHRHRAGHSYNEWSGRYSRMEPEFYVPEFVRTQVGKPGAYSFEPVDEATRETARAEIEGNAARAFAAYERMLGAGVAKEVARAVLPLSTYTKYFWSCNPRSLMHFCSLRNSEHAQHEIRAYALVLQDIVARWVPLTFAAFTDYREMVEKTRPDFVIGEMETAVMTDPAEVMRVSGKSGEGVEELLQMVAARVALSRVSAAYQTT